jgi:ubiquinone/menaquinone biosynthesis C-methylase UbiE
MYFTPLLRSQFGSPSGTLGSRFIAPFMNVANWRHIQTSIQLLAPEPGDTVLDVGFGGGTSLVALSRRVASGKIIGVDFSRDMVQDAAALIRRRGLDSTVSVQWGDVVQLPLSDSSVDKILSCNSLHYWGDIHASLLELKRVLKPGGKVALGFRSATCLRPFEFAWRGFFVCEPDEMAALLKQAGFEIVHVEHRDRWRIPDMVVVVAAKPSEQPSLP